MSRSFAYALALLAASGLSSGCELIAGFDREKIPLPSASLPDLPSPDDDGGTDEEEPAPDAGSDPLDAGSDAGGDSMDAGSDAGAEDAGGDAAVPMDASEPSDGGSDASTDGGSDAAAPSDAG